MRFDLNKYVDNGWLKVSVCLHETDAHPVGRPHLHSPLTSHLTLTFRQASSIHDPSIVLGLPVIASYYTVLSTNSDNSAHPVLTFE